MAARNRSSSRKPMLRNSASSSAASASDVARTALGSPLDPEVSLAKPAPS